MKTEWKKLLKRSALALEVEALDESKWTVEGIPRFSFRERIYLDTLELLFLSNPLMRLDSYILFALHQFCLKQFSISRILPILKLVGLFL